MSLKSKKLSLIAVLALLGATLVAPPAWAATVSCSTSGSFTVTNNVVDSFSDCAGEAEIPNGVTKLDDYAFYKATSLTSITFEADSELKSIGRLAFFQTSLTSITIPNSVTSIDYGAFHSVTSLTSITFEADSELKSIDDYAFFNNESLTSITIPNSVTSIGDEAFRSSYALTSITFQGDAPSVGINGFLNVDRDAAANIGFSAKEFGTATTWNGLKINRDAAGTVRCSTEGTFTVTSKVLTGNTDCVGSAVIPNGVTSIGDNAFWYVNALTSITIPNSVTSIGSGAFRKTSLTSITIPDGVITIGDTAFQDSRALTSVTFEADSVLKSIGSAAFRSTSLTSVTIPNGVTSIGLYAFYRATSLTSVTFEGDAPKTVGTNAFGSVGRDAVANIGFSAKEFGTATTWNGLTIIRAAAEGPIDCGTTGTFTITNNVVTGNTNCAGSAAIPNTVTSIGNRAFADARALQTVSFAAGSSLTSIGNSAFDGARSLTAITIPNSVTSIGEYAFNNATSLTSITIPNSVASIATWAFNNATALESLAFAGDAPTIGLNAFNNTSADLVVKVNFAAEGFGTATTWKGLTIIRAAADGPIDCSTSGTFTITNNVVTGNSKCAGEAEIPNSVTRIGNYAFSSATALTSITIPNSVTSIDYQAFSGATSLTSITFEANSVLKSIGAYMFFNSESLTSITIPNSVTSIGSGAFKNATSLTSITFEADSVLKSIAGYAFHNNESLTSITIPNSVTSIGSGAFKNATSLTSVTFEGNAPKTVGRWAFETVGNDPVANIGIAAEDFGTATTWNGLTIVRAGDTTPPTVTPVTGETNAGATLAIKGTNMDRITEVKIGGTVAPITARSAISVTVTVPAGLAVGDYTISLTTDDATLLAGGVAKVVALAPPTVTPVTGDTNAGATLVIKGTNMDRITEVKIGGTVAPITARTTTSVTVTVPAGLAVGDYTISLTTDDATLLAGGVAQVVAGEVKAATSQKANAGSFNTYVAVYAKGYKGQTLVWKIAGKWFSTVLTEDYQVFQRKTIAVGLEVKVDLFIDGERLLAKTVLTK